MVLTSAFRVKAEAPPTPPAVRARRSVGGSEKRIGPPLSQESPLRRAFWCIGPCAVASRGHQTGIKSARWSVPSAVLWAICRIAGQRSAGGRAVADSNPVAPIGSSLPSGVRPSTLTAHGSAQRRTTVAEPDTSQTRDQARPDTDPAFSHGRLLTESTTPESK